MLSKTNNLHKRKWGITVETFGERLKILRLENKFTQNELSELLFLNKSSISRYESNKQIPESETLQKIASSFNVSMDYLLGLSDIRNIAITNVSTDPCAEHSDISVDLNNIHEQLMNTSSGKSETSILFNGKQLSKDAIDKILMALEIGMRSINQ